jgi:hypothetical protein
MQGHWTIAQAVDTVREWISNGNARNYVIPPDWWNLDSDILCAIHSAIARGEVKAQGKYVHIESLCRRFFTATPSRRP